ncbi:MAG TPA: hypothetical protein VF681_05930 [Abditibacteriaceae bacterium]
MPWADEAERQQAIQTQARQKAQQTANVRPVTQAAKARPVKATTLDDDDMEWWLIIGSGTLILALTAFSYWRLSLWEANDGIHLM